MFWQGMYANIVLCVGKGFAEIRIGGLGMNIYLRIVYTFIHKFVWAMQYFKCCMHNIAHVMQYVFYVWWYVTYVCVCKGIHRGI